MYRGGGGAYRSMGSSTSQRSGTTRRPGRISGVRTHNFCSCMHCESHKAGLSLDTEFRCERDNHDPTILGSPTDVRFAQDVRKLSDMPGDQEPSYLSVGYQSFLGQQVRKDIERVGNMAGRSENSIQGESRTEVG
ncbi:hypothetical protein I316_02673 [Kwoniella heveanensis BCC8398]|uniref:Uncharacterized protein n=1 Tax=Kwoniella heveanensis BCC8398 TaxID=1296120 RepID=A0A1B9GX60_9TREE|nr:hypothetical protein I316_02673 [Kwoniella heveanensis BCC8398]